MKFSEWIQTELTQMPWYHGTTVEKAQAIMSSRQRLVLPGQPTKYRLDIPRHNAVYITSDLGIAKGYGQAILEVVVRDQNKLIPDEDDVYEILGDPRPNALGRKVKALWLQMQNRNTQDEIDAYGPQHFLKLHKNFSSAWKSYANELDAREEQGMSSPASDVIGFVDHLVESDRQLCFEIITAGRKAAHLGPITVVRILS